MREIREGMQRFYIENRVVELTLDFDQACILMGAISSRLKESVKCDLNITIPLAITSKYEVSTIYDDVICPRVIAPLEAKLSSRTYAKIKNDETDLIDLMQEYFNV